MHEPRLCDVSSSCPSPKNWAVTPKNKGPKNAIAVAHCGSFAGNYLALVFLSGQSKSSLSRTGTHHPSLTKLSEPAARILPQSSCGPTFNCQMLLAIPLPLSSSIWLGTIHAMHLFVNILVSRMSMKSGRLTLTNANAFHPWDQGNGPKFQDWAGPRLLPVAASLMH